MTNRSITTAYIGARLVPALSNGWYAPLFFWTEVTADREFYTQYWVNGTAANNLYTNWQSGGLPPTTEPYAQRPLVLHDLNVGWRAFRPNGTAIWMPCLTIPTNPNDGNWQFQTQVDQYGLYYFNITLYPQNISNFTLNLDSYCINMYANGRALRVVNAEVQQNLTASMTNRSIDQAYIGARLMPWFSRGWYWAADDWNDTLGILFFSEYWRNGTAVNGAYTNFASATSLPDPSDPNGYGYYPLLIQNQSVGGWEPFRPTGASLYIACTVNASNITYTTPPSPATVDENGIYFANVTLTEDDIENNAVNLDQYCEGENSSGQALRVTSEELQQYLESSLATRNIDAAFIGARLMPQFTNGWYWAADDWNDQLGFLFFSEYWRNGTAVNGAYTNFANATSLPDPSDPNGYGYYPLLIQNQSAGGWEPFRADGTEVYAACTVNASTLNYTAGPSDNSTSNESNETEFVLITVNESDINSTWDNGGLDALCQDRLSGRTNVSAARIYTIEDQTTFISNLSGYDPTQRLYLGARLYPNLSPGWYWAGPNWSQKGSALFYTTYANNSGSISLQYTNWAANGLPPNDEMYGTRQAVIYNQTIGGWQTVSLQSNGEAQIACSINQVFPPSRGNSPYYFVVMHWNELEIGTFTTNQPVTLNAQESLMLADSNVDFTWTPGGLDALCQNRLSVFQNVTAARIYTQEDETLLQASLWNYTSTLPLFIGARLYPDLTQGWYWAGPNWAQDGAQLFYTTYNEGGESVGFTDWAADDGLPPAGEPYLTRQGVSYNQTAGGWQAVIIQEEQPAQILCAINQSVFVIPTTATATSTALPTSPWRYVHHGMAYYGYIIIFVPIAVIIIAATVIAFAALFLCMPEGYLSGNTQPYYEGDNDH